MASETQREGSGIDGRAIGVAALAVLLTVVMVTALVRLLSALNQTSIQPTRRDVQPPALSSPDAAGLLQSYQAAQAARLNGYGWEDPGHAYAHIPIASAMQLLLQHPNLATPATSAAPAAPAASAEPSAPSAPAAAAPAHAAAPGPSRRRNRPAGAAP